MFGSSHVEAQRSESDESGEFTLRQQVYAFPDGLEARVEPYQFEVTWSNPDETISCAYYLTIE